MNALISALYTRLITRSGGAARELAPVDLLEYRDTLWCRTRNCAAGFRRRRCRLQRLAPRDGMTDSQVAGLSAAL